MKRVVVLNVVGLTRRCLGRYTPQLNRFLERAGQTVIEPAFPAVTCSAQSDYVTGATCGHHGIVGNGWYDRDLCEVHFWKQPDHLVQAPKIWELLKKENPEFTCAKCFWWYNMYGDVDYSITPRPAYPADGRKVFDIYTWPYEIRPAIKGDLGEFPFPCFWGPAAGRKTPQGEPHEVSAWIASAARWLETQYEPTLQLVYLPHLDYNFQRFGPDHVDCKKDILAIDHIVGELIDFFESRQMEIIVLSEYGITPVNRPIHLNREFRKRNWLVIKEELGRELIDYGASPVFAVADHQVAHVYVRNTDMLSEVESLLRSVNGIQAVWTREERLRRGLQHRRAGDLVAVADEDAWFTYYYWEDDNRAPDFARTVDIHRKPGYDPVELFIDPTITFPKLKIAWRLLQKKLGFRMLMDLIPLDAGLVKGSHGCRPKSQEDWPIYISSNRARVHSGPIQSQEVMRSIYDHVKGGP